MNSDSEQPSDAGQGHSAEVTLLLQAIRNDEDGASDRLLELVYDQLHRLADAKMQNERPDHTLQATALVHEAYMRLLGTDGGFENRRHFFGAAAQAMRRILIDRYRRNHSEKRGGSRERVDQDLGGIVQQGDGVEALDLLALDEALKDLEVQDPRMAQIVMLRFFAGLDVEQTAEALEISPRTVKRDWAVARAWLFQRLGGNDAAE
ncbi:MAG: sigma-70 family RNA polymerase sigma factor [Planctomycetes bacterium]|nr:sigma-70 family RNA polymerase sigma factor [Planctomycetota bacterium]